MSSILGAGSLIRSVSRENLVKKPINIAVQVLLVVAVGILLWSVLYRPRHIHPSAITATCLHNLRQIGEAKAEWARASSKAPGDTPAWSDLVGTNRHLRVLPECPGGGTYTIGTVGEDARCTIAGHML
jgi:hypothetical protein